MSDEIQPGRRLEIEYDVTGYELNRPPSGKRRKAEQMRPSASQRVILYPHLGWGLEAYQFTQRFYKEEVINDGAIRKSEFNTTESMQERPHYKPESGASVGAGVSGDYWIHKERASSSSDDEELTDDVAALPKPTLESEDYPMLRVASSTTTYDENQGFCIRFQAPATQLDGADNILTVYMGGDGEPQPASVAAFAPASNTTSTPSPGGLFAFVFEGSGLAKTFEWIRGEWEKITTFRFAQPGKVAGGMHMIGVKPSRNTTSIFSAPIPAPNSPGELMKPGPPVPPYFPPLPPAVIKPKRVKNQPRKRRAIASGGVRVDMPRSRYVPFQISKWVYPTSGTLVDGSFALDFPVPAGTRIYLKMDTDEPTGTDISYAIYDATTQTILSTDDEGYYITNEGVTMYYVVFTFTTSNVNRTPFLKSYKWQVVGIRAEPTGDGYTGGVIQEFSLTGPDKDPTHEMASAKVADLYGELENLRYTGEMRCRITTTYDPNDTELKSVLADVICHSPRARRRVIKNYAGMGGSGDLLPEIWEYNLNFVSLAEARLNRTISFVMEDFGVSDDVDANGEKLPWKITDIIKWLLEQAGWHEDDLDIPDLPIRAYTSGESQEYLLQPMAKIGEYIMDLTKNYLGGWMVYDPNAGTRGMWRLKLPPQAPYNVLHEFFTGDPEGLVGHHLVSNSYGTDSTFIKDIETQLCPPEANYLIVVGGGADTASGTPQQIMQIAYNGQSFNIDPDNPTAEKYDEEGRRNPDFIGQCVPLVYYDPTLTTQRGVDFICRRLYQQTCTHVKRGMFRAPAVLVTDPDDDLQTNPRMLRTYDVVKVNDEEFIIESVNLAEVNSQVQWADYQGRFVTTS